MPVISECSIKQNDSEPEIFEEKNVKGVTYRKIYVFYVEPCKFCIDSSLSKSKVKKLYYKNYPWYYEIWLLKTKKIPPLPKWNGKPELVNTKKTDPFNFDESSTWKIRYFASIVRSLYPPEYTIGPNGEKEYLYMFHPRGLYYRIGSSDYCFPYQLKNNVPKDKITQELTEKLGLKRPRDNDAIKTISQIQKYIIDNDINIGYCIFMARSRLNRKTYIAINNMLKLARWGGLVPFEQVAEKRITLGVQPVVPLNSKTIKNESKIQITTNISIDRRVKVMSPLILLYSEKSAITYVLDLLAKKYVLSYYVGSGQVSVTGALQIYEYIKKNTDLAIILTVSDYDKWGFEIPIALARKLQYFSARDQDPEDQKPSILIYRFLIDDESLDQIRAIAKRKNLVNLLETNKVELEALEHLIGSPGYEHCTTLTDVVEMKLKQVFPTIEEVPIKKGNTYLFKQTLIDADMIAKLESKHFEEYKGKVQDEVRKLDEVTLTKLNSELGIDMKTATFDDYVKAMDNWVKKQLPVRTLSDILDKIRYEPLKIEGQLRLDDKVFQWAKKFLSKRQIGELNSARNKVGYILHKMDLKQLNFEDLIGKINDKAVKNRLMKMLNEGKDKRKIFDAIYEFYKSKKYLSPLSDLSYIRVTRLLQKEKMEYKPPTQHKIKEKKS